MALVQKIYRYEEIDSTNLEAKRLGESGAPHGSIVVAARQTSGRGRRGRSWESVTEGNLYFSLLLKPDFEVEKASMLTLVMALAVAKAVEEYRPGIKWPNDIVINGKKLAGILTELNFAADGSYQVIIGVGINVVKQDFAGELADKAISLEEVMPGARMHSEGKHAQETAMISGPSLSEQLLARILNYFENYYDEFVKAGDLGSLKADYENYLVNKDNMVRVLDPKGEYEGKALGINEKGELLVEAIQTSGEIVVKTVYAGEVSVRGIYGYV